MPVNASQNHHILENGLEDTEKNLTEPKKDPITKNIKIGSSRMY